MNELIARTARLYPQLRLTRTNGFVVAYIHEDDPETMAQLGQLLAVVEVLGDTRTAEGIVDLILDTLIASYYDTEPHPEADLSNHFEAAVRDVNLALRQRFERGEASWVGKVSSVLAVVGHDQFHLVSTGSAEAWLYRGGRSFPITERSGSPSRPTLTFASAVSGQLQQGDRLALCTPALLHQVSQEKLEELIAASSPNGAIAEIAGLIDEDEISERTAAVVVEMTTPELMASMPLPTEPAEIELGRAVGPLQAATSAAEPFIKTAASKGQTIFQQAGQHSRDSLWPAVRRGVLGAARAAGKLAAQTAHKARQLYTRFRNR